MFRPDSDHLSRKTNEPSIYNFYFYLPFCRFKSSQVTYKSATSCITHKKEVSRHSGMFPFTVYVFMTEILKTVQNAKKNKNTFFSHKPTQIKEESVLQQIGCAFCSVFVATFSSVVSAIPSRLPTFQSHFDSPQELDK